MNNEDDKVLKLLAEQVTAGVLNAIDALKGAYALGVSRETLDHMKDPQNDKD